MFNSKDWRFSVSRFFPLPHCLAGSSHPDNMTRFKVDLIVVYRECQIIGGGPILPCSVLKGLVRPSLDPGGAGGNT